MGQPDLPQPPPALPPINAKLIFVDRTNLIIPEMVEPYTDNGQLMSHLEVEEENVPTVKLEVPRELPSGTKSYTHTHTLIHAYRKQNI